MRLDIPAMVFAVSLAWLPLAAADKPAKGGVAGEEAGKADARATFKRQDANAVRPTGAEPAFIGAYVWGGRADQNYRPFFQWELRLAGGSAKAEDVRARIATLGPSRQVLNQGDWKEWGAVEAGATIEGTVHIRAGDPVVSLRHDQLPLGAGQVLPCLNQLEDTAKH